MLHARLVHAAMKREPRHRHRPCQRSFNQAAVTAKERTASQGAKKSASRRCDDRISLLARPAPTVSTAACACRNKAGEKRRSEKAASALRTVAGSALTR